MAHDRKVTVTLKKLLRNEGLKHLMLVQVCVHGDICAVIFV